MTTPASNATCITENTAMDVDLQPAAFAEHLPSQICPPSPVAGSSQPPSGSASPQPPLLIPASRPQRTYKLPK